jgi:hypothetical protein
MMARIGMLRALNRGYVREFDSSRKDTHWGGSKSSRGISCPTTEKAGGRYTVGFSLRLPARGDVRFRRIPT